MPEGDRPPAARAKVGRIASQKLRAGVPSVLTASSSEITSLSVLECDTADCPLLTAAIGAKVLGPTRANTRPDVDLLVCLSPATVERQLAVLKPISDD